MFQAQVNASDTGAHSGLLIADALEGAPIGHLHHIPLVNPVDIDFQGESNEHARPAWLTGRAFGRKLKIKHRNAMHDDVHARSARVCGYGCSLG